MVVLWRSRGNSARAFSHFNPQTLEPLERRILLSTTFRPSTIPLGGGDAYAVAVADLNGDGKLDLVTANFNGSVTVLLGNGDSTFQTAVVKQDTLANGVASLAVGDFNNDGSPDVVVASAGTYGEVAILINKGNGTFKPPRLVQVAGNQTQGLAVADFNSDGNADIVAVNNYGAMSLLRGHGDGTFRPFKTIALENAAGGNVVAEGDFNHDGKPDVVIASAYDSAYILLNNGDGTFRDGASATVGNNARSIALADFNGDGNLDMAVGAGDGSITVVLSNADGSLGAPLSLNITTQVDNVGAADVTGDGIPDILYTAHNYYGYGYAGFLLNNGDATFQSGDVYGTPTKFPHGVTAGDFTGDGLEDVAATDATYGNIDFLTNTSVDVPTVILSGTTVIVTGTPDANTITATISGNNIVIGNDSVTQSYPLSEVQSLNIHPLGGDDTVTLGTGIPAWFVGGGGGDDVVIGHDSANGTFRGGAGNDSIQSGDGSDFLAGGTGNDTLFGGAGFDIFKGNTGDDCIHGGTGIAQILGNTGNDTLIAGGGATIMRGSDGTDLMDGSAGNAFLSGGTGSDTLLGAQGIAAPDTLTGNTGSDSLRVGPHDIFSNDPTDTVTHTG